MAAKKAAQIEKALIQASADAALDALGKASDAEALIKAWVDEKNVDAVATAANSAQGAARKAARRALNVLKSRGIKPADTKRVASVASKQEKTLEAWMLAPDAAGNVLLAVGARAPAGRYDCTFTFLHDERGIFRIETGDLSQSQLKDSFARALPGATYKPVNVPVDWARARIAAARAKQKELGGIEPLGFDTAKHLLEPVPESVPSHPFDAEGFVLTDDDARERTKNSAALHLLAEFRGWYPTKNAVDEMMLELGKGFTPGEEPEPKVVEERMQEQIAAATDRYFSPQLRETLVKAMKDGGYSVLQREGEEKALDVAATMKVTEQAGLITDPPREVPFLRAFFEKAVSLMLAQSGGQLKIPIPMGALPDEAPPPVGEAPEETPASQ